LIDSEIPEKFHWPLCGVFWAWLTTARGWKLPYTALLKKSGRVPFLGQEPFNELKEKKQGGFRDPGKVFTVDNV